MSRVLLTGATGFLGCQVLEHLLERGYEVHAASSRSAPTQGPAAPAHWHAADLLDPQAAEQLVGLARPTHLVHCAWYARPGAVWNSLENVRWVEASLRLLRAFGVAGGQRAVFVGSCAEYDWRYGLCSESRTPTAPASLYGASKDGLRRVVDVAAGQLDVSLAWARPFFLYGPHEHPDRLVPAIVRPLLRGEAAACSEGSQLRDYLHVVDAAAALVAILECGPINVGSGMPVRVRDIVATLGDAVGRPDLVRYGAIAGSSSEVPLVLADIARLRRETGWSPRIELTAGLKDAVAFWRHSASVQQAQPT
jgi:nucleoside-diphosphate-sugar epimerase